MSATLDQAAQEYAAELTEMGIAPEHVLNATLGYTRGWQDAQKTDAT